MCNTAITKVQLRSSAPCQQTSYPCLQGTIQITIYNIQYAWLHKIVSQTQWKCMLKKEKKTAGGLLNGRARSGELPLKYEHDDLLSEGGSTDSFS